MSTRLERSDWVDAALDALYAQGIEGVKIEVLAELLEVTKGSFYHHFQDRAELLRAMVERWRAIEEGSLQSLVTASAGDAGERLEQAVNFLQAKDARHDQAVRAWARSDDYARRALSAVDRGRLRYLEGLFRRIGFSLAGARMRARMLYFYQLGEHSLGLEDPEALKRRLRTLRLQLVARGAVRKVRPRRRRR